VCAAQVHDERGGVRGFCCVALQFAGVAQGGGSIAGRARQPSLTFPLEQRNGWRKRSIVAGVLKECGRGVIAGTEHTMLGFFFVDAIEGNEEALHEEREKLRRRKAREERCAQTRTHSTRRRKHAALTRRDLFVFRPGFGSAVSRGKWERSGKSPAAMWTTG